MMNLIRALLLFCVVTGSYAYWMQHKVSSRSVEASSQRTAGGFVTLPPVEDQRPQTVFVVAAENCPHEDAQRADRLAEALTQQGIPVERIHQVRFRFTAQPDAATVENINKIMKGPLPAVFVNGRAKSNPTIEEVSAEFRQAP